MVGPGQGRGHPAYLGAARCWVGGDHQLKVGVVHPAQKIVPENVPENIHHKVRVFFTGQYFSADGGSQSREGSPSLSGGRSLLGRRRSSAEGGGSLSGSKDCSVECSREH